jgi:hypothetical protein
LFWGSWWYHNIQSFHTLCGKVSWWKYDISFRFSQDTHLNKQTLGYTYIIYIPWWHCDTLFTQEVQQLPVISPSIPFIISLVYLRYLAHMNNLYWSSSTD